MLRFERTRDTELVRGTVTHPRLWRWHTEDGAPAPEDWTPHTHDERIWFVGVWDGAEYLGLFALLPSDETTWEIHTYLLPHSWGERALRAYRDGIAWVWANTARTKILGAIPEDNRLALRIAARAGLQRIKKAPRRQRLKNGKPMRIVHMEITK